VASLPAIRNANSELDERERTVVRLIRRGWPSGAIAQKLAPSDPRRQKVIREYVRRTIARDPGLKTEIGLASQGTLIETLPDAAQALAHRASRGNIPAIKLLMEVVRFHNPRQEVEHSGDIKITVIAPRPPRVEDEVVDADVVD
jgi:hypothetical protein